LASRRESHDRSGKKAHQPQAAGAKPRAKPAAKRPPKRKSPSPRASPRVREAELAILDSVQKAIAAALDLTGIYEAVGAKLRKIFRDTDLQIRIYDPASNVVSYVYTVNAGKRVDVAPEPLHDRGFGSHVIRTRETIVVNDHVERAIRKYRSNLLPGTIAGRSLVFVPLVAGGECRGLINLVDVEREHAFSESDVQLLQAIAAGTAVALENARLFKETEQRNAELAVINSIQEGMAGKLDFQGIVDLVGDKLRQVLRIDTIGIRWYDHDKRTAHFLYEIERGKRMTLPPVQPSEARWKQVVSDRGVIVRNTAAEVAAAGLAAGSECSLSTLTVKMVAADRVVGVVVVESFEREHAFGDSEVRLLQTIVGSMGVALENARLFDETQRLLKETEQRNAQLAVINSVQSALAAELSIDGIYRAVGDKIREIFHTADIGIRIHDPRTGLVHFPYYFKDGAPLALPPSPIENAALTRHVLALRKTLVLNEGVAEFARSIGSAVMGADYEKSSVFVPLIVGDRAWGVLNLLDMRHERAFNESDVRLLETLAASMSVALENARLFDETQHLLKETEQRNAELAVINAIQQGMAASLDFRAIIDLVGARLEEVFGTGDISIRWLDARTGNIRFFYEMEHGKRFERSDRPPSESPMWRRLAATRAPVVRNTPDELEALGLETFPGTDTSLSALGVPILVGERMAGCIVLNDFTRERAYGPSEVRLLSTIASGMGIALENARLFDETQRLLKETEQRAAELAVINSIQEGIAGKRDFQGIVDLVGDKLREVFHTGDIGIRWHEPSTDLIHYLYDYVGGSG
jgi:GAF domain-containing protein